jgi:F-type H+-transporting ATPase subunit a
LEKTRKWRWGTNRWWVLGLIVLSWIAVTYIAVPIQPFIQVAPEKILLEPLFHLPVIGDFYLVNTLTSLLLVDIIILLLALSVRKAIKGGALVPTGVTAAFEMMAEFLYNMTETSAGKHAKKIFPWFASIMVFVFVANITKLIPGFETIGLMHHSEEGYEITNLAANWAILTPVKATGEGFMVTPFFRGVSTDLNFTLALALISVIMVQVVGVQTQGLRYFTKFFNTTTLFKKPAFGFIDFAVGFLELISEFAKILSFTFRLFGVMFSGTVLVALMGSMLPVFGPSMIYMFELFMGLIQAFVFGMLTMVFMVQATQGHGDHAEEH